MAQDPKRRAAIPVDEKALDKQLDQLSAHEFLQILNRSQLDRHTLAILPDKKKYELWVDETGLPKITVGDLLQRIRREKKKLELEKFRFEDMKLAVEFDIDPTRTLVDPRVVEEIATLVAEKLRAGK